MLEIKKITTQSEDLPKIMKLYNESFPPNERDPLDVMLEDESWNAEVLGFYEDGVFCALACLLSYGDLTHILYLAVEPAARDHGCGSRVLQALRRHKPTARILADIEDVREEADNHEQRVKRREFYLRNGYTESPVAYRWHGTDYVILVNGGMLTEHEFSTFWEHFDHHGSRYEGM